MKHVFVGHKRVVQRLQQRRVSDSNRQRRTTHLLAKLGRRLAGLVMHKWGGRVRFHAYPLSDDPIHARFKTLRAAERQLPVNVRRSKRVLRQLARESAS